MAQATRDHKQVETPLETAARLRAELGVALTERMRRHLPRQARDEMWGDTAGSSKGER